MKNVIVFGSTGSIGVNTLKVIRNLKDRFRVVGLAANANIDLLRLQIEEFAPEVVAVSDTQKAAELQHKVSPAAVKILNGKDGLLQLAANKAADIVVMAISTSVALEPLLAAIDSGKRIALANKEALVTAGNVITERARQRGAEIIPVDSEHSAVFQCIDGQNKKYLKNIYLTATGGPLRKIAISKMYLVSPLQAIKHPKWAMGKKISVDSATMMNKGLEVIEAKWLFGVDIDKIQVLIHPEAVVHSMVEFADNSVIAQMAVCDMKLPIQYALTYPERFASGIGRLDFSQLKKLTFTRPNFKKFPCLGLAYEAARAGGTMPAVLNAANEELVKMYLDGKIKLTDIAKGIEKAMKKHKVQQNPGLDEIRRADAWAREQVALCYQS